MVIKLWYIPIFLLAFLVFPTEAVTTTIDFKQQYHDWDWHVYDYSAANLEAHPLYVKVDNGDNWGIVRKNVTEYLRKQVTCNGSVIDMNYFFYPERIVPQMKIDNYQQISNCVTKDSSTRWYFTLPFSSNYFVSVTDDLIDMGVFKRTTKVTVTDSNITSCGLLENVSCPDLRVVPKVVNNEIRLYFNPQNFSNVVYPLFLTENTITIDNATFWSTQDCGDGYWSAYSGGSCATPLNDSIHVNLSGYWDMELNTSSPGTTLYGINRYGKFPNSSIAAIWSGNTTLNYTGSRNWGNALLLDGTDDFLTIPSAAAGLSTQGGVYALARTHVLNKTGYIWVDYQDGSNENRFYILNDVLGFAAYDYGAYQYILSGATDSNWNNVYGAFGVNYAELFKNGTSLMNDASVNMGSYTHNVRIGLYPLIASSYFDGEIDEVIIITYPSSVSVLDTPYAVSWNMSFLNNTATAGSVIDAVKFNIYNINTQNNTVNISTRQTGNLTWVQIATDYVSDTWINQTFNTSTDFAVNVSGNGSSRAFIINMTYDESPLPPELTYSLNGTVNNTLGAPVEWALITWDNQTDFTNETGYYEFANATSGEHTLTAQHVGYETHTETFDLTMNMTKNITLSEKETVSEDTAIDYSIVGAMLGGLLAFVLLRRKRKDDDYKYKRE